MEQSPAAGRTADHLDAEAGAGVGVDVVVGLEAPERERGRRPAVEPQRRRRPRRDLVEQRLVGRHLGGGVEASVEVVDQAPGPAPGLPASRDRRQPSSTSARYAAASSSASTSAGSAISTTKIQPAP